jgi:hypothetical protein
MQRMLFVMAVVSTLVLSSVASAAEARPARAEMNGARKGPIAKLIELERRKNEWLRQQFGRGR